MAEHVVHTTPRRVYYTVYAILLLCTYLTVQIAFFDLGILNTIAAVTIAVVKATLVVFFFMHVRERTGLTGVIAASAIFWLVIMLALTMGDYLTRGWPL
jgi:cytochrome c oxidase subunit 4